MDVKGKRCTRNEQQWEKAVRGSDAAPESSGRSLSTACALPHFAVSSSFLQTLNLHLALNSFRYNKLEREQISSLILLGKGL